MWKARSTILNRHKSDEASQHGYDRACVPLFKPLKREPITILGIGVEDGHSLKTWAEYFSDFTHPNTRIVGLAYNNTLKQVLDDKRMTVLHGPHRSHDDKAVQLRMAEKVNYTIIIDDGSHVPYSLLPSHQWNTFLALWPFVKAGGIYAIEDIETN